MRLILSLLATLWLTAGNALAANTEATLILAQAIAKPGSTVNAALRLKMAPGWHTYWQNPGESGMATKLVWDLPEGITAGEIQWPAPEKLVAEGITTFIYEGEAFLIIPISVGPGVKTGSVSLKAKASWLECETQCLPGKANVAASLEIGTESKDSTDAGLVTTALARIPKASDQPAATAAWNGPASGESRQFRIQFEAPKPGNWDFFAYRFEDGDISPATTQAADGSKVELLKSVKLAEGVTNWPASVKGLLVRLENGKSAEAVEKTLQIGGATAPVAAAATTSAGAPSQATPISLPLALILAFFGGMILNIMPCVLPVISLKILGFVNQAAEEPGHVRKLGLLYGVGVIASFMILAGLVLGVRAAGNIASWGMQFQNPVFVVTLTTLVVLVSLNLFGVFEVNLHSSAWGAAAQAASKEGPAGAFFNGVLATVLATPCTAPMLGAALGFAFTQPAFVTVLVFLSAGVGLAAPYVALCWNPKWLKLLPRPGAWMVKFKMLMGFPMLATAIWLFSVALGQFGRENALPLGLFLVVVSLAAFVFGEFVQKGSTRQGLSMVIAVGLLVGGYAYFLEKELHWRNPARPDSSSGVVVHEGGIPWKKWSASAVEEARKAGHPVLVDFTADWCLTCQVNKKTSIEIESVREKLKQLNAVALLGDYTREDPAIAAEIRKYLRAGVPLVLVFPADPSQPAMVLPEVLKPSFVLDALEKAKQR